MGNVKLVNAESFGMSVVRSSARWLVIVCLATLALAGIMPTTTRYFT